MGEQELIIKKLKLTMQTFDLSTEELSEKSKVKIERLEKLLNGKGVLYVEELCKLASGLNVSLDFFVQDENATENRMMQIMDLFSTLSPESKQKLLKELEKM